MAPGSSGCAAPIRIAGKFCGPDVLRGKRTRNFYRKLHVAPPIATSMFSASAHFQSDIGPTTYTTAASSIALMRLRRKHSTHFCTLVAGMVCQTCCSKAAAHRLPIIAQAVGGIGEILTEATGWPISATSDTADFDAALRQVCFEFDQHSGPDRIAAMSELIRTRHSFETFCQRVGAIFEGKDFDYVDHQHHHCQ